MYIVGTPAYPMGEQVYIIQLVTKPKACGSCQGTGTATAVDEKGTKRVTFPCFTCKGSGVIEKETTTLWEIKDTVYTVYEISSFVKGSLKRASRKHQYRLIDDKEQCITDWINEENIFTHKQVADLECEERNKRIREHI